MIVLCFNVGSSSLKYAAYDMSAGERCLLASDAHSFDDAMREINARSLDPDVIAHRVVFGGPDHEMPARVTPDVLANLRGMIRYDPLHMEPEIAAIESAIAAFPRALQTVSFDTAFFRGMPAVSRMLPIPRETDPFVQRYGYHGISYDYIVSALGDRARGNVVIAHLGNGASLAAVRNGKPIDTTMGFSPFGGIMMGTRPGDLDPGVVLELLHECGNDAQRLTDLLVRRSGLRGVSGTTADMRELLAASTHDAAAAAAVGLFVHTARKGIAAMTASLGGFDRLVFTGGIGEHAAPVRDLICSGLRYLVPAAIDVIPTNENLMLARHAQALYSAR